MTTIRPSDIDRSKGFMGSPFRNSETEASASWIVRYCQEQNDDSWAPFSVTALEAFYQETLGERGNEKFWFNRLTKAENPAVVVDRENDLVTIRPKFVMACFHTCGVAEFPGIPTEGS